MKKKVFFILASLIDGGSEKVFWLLSQGFNKKLYDVNIILLDSNKGCFSTELSGVTFINLDTKKASKSFFKLYKLIKKEQPYVVFSTTDHINILVSFVSLFVKIPNLIARASNNPHQMKHFEGLKSRFWMLFTRLSYNKYDKIVCQTEEMKQSVLVEYNLNPKQLVVIPNPVLYTNIIKEANRGNGIVYQKKLLIVARMSKEKGFDRLLEIFSELPETYFLSIAGDGPLKNDIVDKINLLKISSRVKLLGRISNVIHTISKHDVFVLSSFTEGFPNVILESLSVGVPVVTFRVGGISGLVRDGFNGYVVEQDDMDGFKNKVITACNKVWNADVIKEDVCSNYALDKVVQQYECLIK